MLVDKMEYQGQQGGGGGGQDDTFYELLSSTAMANAKKQQQQHHEQQQQQQQHSQQQRTAFDSVFTPVLPSYDFQQSSASSYGGVVESHNSEEKAPAMTPVVSSYPSPQFQPSRQHLPIPSFVESSPGRQERGSFVESSPGRQERGSNTEAATVAAVEQTMKKYMDDLVHMMESMSGRIGQLESSTRRLEQMVTDFKNGSEKNEGAAGGKLAHLETMLSGVQRGIIELCHKQEAMEAQVNLGKLHLSSEDSIGSAPTRASVEPPPPQSPRAPQLPESSSYPPHHPAHHAPPPPYMVPPQLVGLAAPPPPPPPPAGHTEPHYPPSQPPPPPQFYQQQQQQQQQAPPPPPLGHPHGPPAFSHQPELPPFTVPFKGQAQSFGQEVSYRQQGPPPPPSGSTGGYELPPYQSQGRPAAPVYEQQQQQPGYNPGYRTPSAPSSGAGGYPRLPTAQPVHHAREREGTNPAAAAPGGATPLSTNRLSIDEVIDKVAVMGFSKDQVRAVVRRLTENGQSVDLNIVLDKLMNGEAGQQQKGWFQRG